MSVDKLQAGRHRHVSAGAAFNGQSAPSQRPLLL